MAGLVQLLQWVSSQWLLRGSKAWAGLYDPAVLLQKPIAPQSLLVPAREREWPAGGSLPLLPDCRRLSPAGGGTAPPHAESRAQFQTPCTARSGRVCVCKVRRGEGDPRDFWVFLSYPEADPGR